MVIRPQRAKQALECLVLFISVRRSLFQDNARKTFLLRIMTAVCEIMRERIGLHDMDCYHQFCRLLGKLKANYQLSDLVTTAGYPEWIKLAADFAVTSFKQIHNVSNSAHYILGLWSRLVAAAPHLSSAARAVSVSLLAYIPLGLPWPPRHSLTAVAPIALVAPPHTHTGEGPPAGCVRTHGRLFLH